MPPKGVRTNLLNSGSYSAWSWRFLSEQKTAKVIQLLEEVRRDSPHIHDRVDQEAEVMARPADPQSVLDSIKETHTDAKHIFGSGGDA